MLPDAAAVAVFLPVQALVLTGAGDTLLIEQLGDRYFSHAVLKEGEDARHHGGGSGVHHQPVVVIRVLAVTVRGEGADELPLPLFGAEGTPHFREMSRAYCSLKTFLTAAACRKGPSHCRSRR